MENLNFTKLDVPAIESPIYACRVTPLEGVGGTIFTGFGHTKEAAIIDLRASFVRAGENDPFPDVLISPELIESKVVVDGSDELFRCEHTQSGIVGWGLSTQDARHQLKYVAEVVRALVVVKF